MFTKLPELPLYRPIYFLIYILLLSCSREETPHTPTPMRVRTKTIIPHTIPQTFEFVGFAQSSHQVEIRARVEGYLDKILYKEGEVVKQGDIMFQLDPRVYEAELENLQGVLAKQEAILWNAKRTSERLKTLFEQKATSRRDLDNSIAQELTAQAEVQSAKARLKDAELNLSYTTIKSPITGLTADSNFQEGALITPGSSGLMTMVSAVNPIWVYFSVTDQNILTMNDQEAKGLLKLPENMDFDIELLLSDGSVYPLRGKVNFTSPTVDQKTGTVSIRAEVSNPQRTLMPGQFVRVRVLGATRPDAVLVPQKAVLQGKAGAFVYVVNAANQAEVRPVETGSWHGEDWVIFSGLKEGEQVIVDGVNKIRPGTPVEPIQ